VITSSFPPISGGASLRMWRFCKSLQNNLKIEVLTKSIQSLSDPLDLSILSKIERVKVHRANIYPIGKIMAFMPWLKLFFPADSFENLIPFIRNGRKILKKSNFDYILGVYPTFTSLFSSFILSKFMRIPLIIDMHDLFYDSYKHTLHTILQKKIYLKLERRVLYHASLISVVTKEFKMILNNLHGIKQEKFLIIPNNVDLDEFKSIKIVQKEDFIISHVGFLADYHLEGVYLLIKAINKIKKEDMNSRIKFRLVGPLTQGLKEKLNKIDEFNIVEYYNFVKKNEANSLMINSDALFLTLSPSHKFAIEMRSTNPSKLFEYIGCGKPILAYLPRGSTQILITENNLGFVLTKYQPGEMAKFIKELMNNESLRENFSKNALILAKKFDSKLVYQTFLKRISLRKS